MSTTQSAIPTIAGEPRTDLTNSAGHGRVEISRLVKDFGTQRVLDDVTLSIEPGEVVSIIGPSGSGKSTLLRTINYLETFDSGSVTVDGTYIGYERRGDVLHELREGEVLRRRTRVGIVFQQFNLFPNLTVSGNITIAPVSLGRLNREQARQRALELLRRVGLENVADRYPRQLSGGQQQRVAIARALALEPRVLLFDEPTSALDPELVAEVLDVIRELARSGTTLIIVTHEIAFAREVSDRIIFFDRGRIGELGAPDQVLDDPQNPRTRAFVSSVL